MIPPQTPQQQQQQPPSHGPPPPGAAGSGGAPPTPIPSSNAPPAPQAVGGPPPGPPGPGAPPPVMTRLPDILDALRQEVETVTHDLGMYKLQRDEFEQKLSLQIGELAAMQQCVMEIETMQRRNEQQYQDEILRLRKEIEARDAAAAAAAAHYGQQQQQQQQQQQAPPGQQQQGGRHPDSSVPPPVLPSPTPGGGSAFGNLMSGGPPNDHPGYNQNQGDPQHPSKRMRGEEGAIPRDGQPQMGGHPNANYGPGVYREQPLTPGGAFATQQLPHQPKTEPPHHDPYRQYAHPSSQYTHSPAPGGGSANQSPPDSRHRMPQHMGQGPNATPPQPHYPQPGAAGGQPLPPQQQQQQQPYPQQPPSHPSSMHHPTPPPAQQQQQQGGPPPHGPYHGQPPPPHYVGGPPPPPMQQGQPPPMHGGPPGGPPHGHGPPQHGGHPPPPHGHHPQGQVAPPPQQQQQPPMPPPQPQPQPITGICDHLAEVDGHGWRTETKDWAAISNPRSYAAMGGVRFKLDQVHALDHRSVVCCVRFSPDGRYLATGSNKKAQVFDVWTGACLHLLETSQDDYHHPDGPKAEDMGGADLYVRSVCFSPDSWSLATGAEDRVVRIYHLGAPPPTQGNGAANPSTGATNGAKSDGKPMVQTRPRVVLRGHGQDIYSLDWSRDGRFIVSGSGDRSVRIWDAETGRELMVLDNEEDKVHGGFGGLGAMHQQQDAGAGVTSVAVSPVDPCVITGSLDNVIRLWDIRTGQLLERFIGHTNSVYSVSFFPDGRSIVSGSLDKTLKIWDLSPTTVSILNHPAPREAVAGTITTGACRHTFSGHKDFVLSVSAATFGSRSGWILPSDRSAGVDPALAEVEWVVSGSKDRTVTFWDARAAPPGSAPDQHLMPVVMMLQGHKNSVISVALAPGNGIFATGSGDKMVCVWRVVPVDMRAPPLQQQQAPPPSSSSSSQGMAANGQMHGSTGGRGPAPPPAPAPLATTSSAQQQQQGAQSPLITQPAPPPPTLPPQTAQPQQLPQQQQPPTPQQQQPTPPAPAQPQQPSSTAVTAPQQPPPSSAAQQMGLGGNLSGTTGGGAVGAPPLTASG
ncbi:general transcription repressor, partial [Dinochytrium kinnereticum]